MQVLTVTGMTCGGCAKSVEKAVIRVAPDAGPKVDLAAGKVSFADGVDTAQVIQAIERAGFGASPA
ncbi:heavy-metal-associated domain-containing protein [Zavarzinia compransoris]|uniref:Heavy metal transporter n=1 Tax=Zavarzinia compransoris TaxID=1264899 RepID=A0A317E8Z4_9PROT|nr:heavy metal-associated domain-containing protein [Zavarzinia compransoris]PWR23201.1 heavy metal transporter [Zavarzinia compransoris]TDP46240.1 copper chaperone [Zavarzinia compransoris]